MKRLVGTSGHTLPGFLARTMPITKLSDPRADHYLMPVWYLVQDGSFKDWGKP